MNCEETRDRLPALAAHRMDANEFVAVEAHLVACADCRETLTAVELVRTPVRLPEGALERIQAAAANNAQRPRVSGLRPAIAAAIAIVAAGSVLLLSRPDGAELVNDPTDAADVGWAARNDPLLHGGTALPELSVGELELLLEELGS